MGESSNASSPGSRHVVVPDLIGLGWREARDEADRAQLFPTSTNPDGPPLSALGWPAGVVVAQDPRPGELVPAGHEVRLHILKPGGGPDPAGVREPRRPSPTPLIATAEAVPEQDQVGLDLRSREIGFEDIYRQAGRQLGQVPWALLEPHPALVDWLERQPGRDGETALVVGCGLGDDAEALAAYGYRVTAFDVSPTALAWCRERFPQSTVDYQVADLFALPDSCRSGFGLVVEIRTLQSLPPARRAEAITVIAQAVRPGGCVFVRCAGREDEELVAARPWPLSREELAGFRTAGLDEVEFHDEPARPGPGRSFTVVYSRRADRLPGSRRRG